MADEEQREDARQRLKEIHGYFQKGDYGNALRLADDAIKLHPKCTLLVRERACCHYVMGNLEAALKDADKAIQLDPNSPKDIANKIIMLRSLGRTREADELMSKASKIFPRFEAWFKTPTREQEEERKLWWKHWWERAFPSFFCSSQNAESKDHDAAIDNSLSSVICKSSEDCSLRKRGTKAH